MSKITNKIHSITLFTLSLICLLALISCGNDGPVFPGTDGTDTLVPPAGSGGNDPGTPVAQPDDPLTPSNELEMKNIGNIWSNSIHRYLFKDSHIIRNGIYHWILAMMVMMIPVTTLKMSPSSDLTMRLYMAS